MVSIERSNYDMLGLEKKQWPPSATLPKNMALDGISLVLVVSLTDIDNCKDDRQCKTSKESHIKYV